MNKATLWRWDSYIKHNNLNSEKKNLVTGKSIPKKKLTSNLIQKIESEIKIIFELVSTTKFHLKFDQKKTEVRIISQNL